MDIFKGLNAAQTEAVKITSGPLLILVGPGSGKTKTLTHRIAHLIANCGIKPDEILAVTFTNKAAKEMRSRLARLLERENSWYFMPYMGTFHGICVKILRESGTAIQINEKFVIYDESDRLGLVKRSMRDLNISDREVKPQLAVAVISSNKNKMISSAEALDQARSQRQKLLAMIYERYETMRQSANALDFDDLLLEVVRLFRTKPKVRALWQERFLHILVDEYQDTNYAQYQIVKMLVNEQRNICVVGDDWQSIYSWRGADFTNILNFKRDWPEAKEVKLEQNYRSTNNILQAAQRLIEQNQQRTDKKIWTEAGDGKPIDVIETRDEVDEANRVAEIVKQVALDGHSLADVAVLYRANAQSYQIEQAFVRYQIPHKVIGGVRFFDRKEVKDILAYIKLIYQPSDSASLLRAINTPARGIGSVTVDDFITWQQTTKYSLVEALYHLKESPLKAAAKTRLERFAKIISQIDQLFKISLAPSEIINKTIIISGYEDYLNDGSVEGEDRLANLGVLVGEASLYGNIESFLEDTALVSSSDQVADGNQVSLMTMHAAKGLEFPVVIMIGMEEGTFPHARAYEDPSELEEERRLCYVAMTRAKEELYLTYAGSRFVSGQRQYLAPSQFLDCIRPNFLKSHFDSEPFYEEVDFINAFEVGDFVESPQFGQGEIIDVDGLAVSVRFNDGKTRKLNTQYANLTKK
ncbi:MAG: ATP-dependent helicase [Candidatus Nanosyncoccaceae bacterium]|jgi:DNA helicase-2/ATP-dependent DNA helicase PcrA